MQYAAAILILFATCFVSGSAKSDSLYYQQQQQMEITQQRDKLMRQQEELEQQAKEQKRQQEELRRDNQDLQDQIDHLQKEQKDWESKRRADDSQRQYHAQQDAKQRQEEMDDKIEALQLAAEIAAALPTSTIVFDQAALDKLKQHFIKNLGISRDGATYMVNLKRRYILDAERDAKGGNADAQFRLGQIYEKGDGVIQDENAATSWYRKAAAQGEAAAQYRLGNMYQHGIGLTQDFKQAALWYEKAAQQGIVGAQFNLGQLYKNGQGIPQDYQQAFVWLQKAAARGSNDAQFSVGELYKDGLGVTQDNQEAYFWFCLASAGNKKFYEQRAKIEKNISPQQVTAIKERLRTWKPVRTEEEQAAIRNDSAAMDRFILSLLRTELFSDEQAHTILQSLKNKVLKGDLEQPLKAEHIRTTIELAKAKLEIAQKGDYETRHARAVDLILAELGK